MGTTLSEFVWSSTRQADNADGSAVLGDDRRARHPASDAFNGVRNPEHAIGAVPHRAGKPLVLQRQQEGWTLTLGPLAFSNFGEVFDVLPDRLAWRLGDWKRSRRLDQRLVCIVLLAQLLIVQLAEYGDISNGIDEQTGTRPARPTASQIASASVASFFCRFT